MMKDTIARGLGATALRRTSAAAVAIEDFGGAPGATGATNDAALLSAWRALEALGGGQILFRAGLYEFDAQFTAPNDGASVPTQTSITFRGAGSDSDGPATGIVKTPTGTRLQFNYQGAGWKVQMLGRGRFTSRGINWVSGGTITSGDGTPFLIATNTDVDFDSTNSFYGQRSGLLASEDAITLGGTTTTLGGTNTCAFQGYNSSINGVFFSKIRRGVYMRTYCNAINVSGLKFWTTCGSNLVGGAAIELDGGADNCTGNTIGPLYCESVNYPYVVKVTKSVQNLFLAVRSYDGGVNALGTINITDSLSQFNTVIGGMNPSGKPYLTDAGTKNIYLSQNEGEQSKLPPFTAGDAGYPVKLVNVKITGGLSSFTIQPDAAATNNVTFQMLRSDLDSTNPGGVVMTIANNGAVVLGDNAGSGNITNNLAAGASWSSNGRKWGFTGIAGSGMEINSGTGGSFLDLKNFGVRNYDHTGALQARFFSTVNSGAGIGWELGPSGDVSYYRKSSTTFATNVAMEAASFAQASGPTWKSGAGSPEGAVTASIGSLYSRTNGAAATSLYVKESGTGNTGWVAK